MQKFDELILRELSTLLQMRFPDQIFSLTQVHVSKDLSFAKVWVSTIKNHKELVHQFSQVAAELRKDLSKKVVARRVPNLYFVADLTEEKAESIDRLLNEIKVEEKK